MSYELNLERKLNVPPTKAFEAWTGKDQLSAWWGMADDWQTTVVEVDLKEGGRYRLGMRDPGGDEHIVGGEYKKVIEGKLVEYTWKWEHGENTTLVRVEFIPDGDGCLLKLNHSAFVETEHRDKHNEGWGGCVNQFTKFLDQ